MAAPPFPPVGLVEAGDAPCQQALLELLQPWQRAFAIKVDHASRGAGLRRLRADEVGIGEFLVGENIIGAGNRADLDSEDAGQRQAVDAAGEHQLPAGQRHAPAVVQAMAGIAFLETPDGAIGRRAGEDPGVAEILEIGDGALVEQPGVEPPGAAGLEKVARRDEDQFAAGSEMANALLDEMQVEVGMAVEQARTQTHGGFRPDVAGLDVGRIADDGGELLVLRISKEVDVERRFRAVSGVDLDRHTTGQQRRKRAVAAGRIKHPAAVAAQGQHAANYLGRGEYLAEGGDIVAHRKQGIGRRVGYYPA